MNNKSLHIIFKDEQHLLMGIDLLRSNGFPITEICTPFPVHSLDHKIGLKPSRIPTVGFICGAIGALTGFFFQSWVFTKSWPMNFGGKPLLAIPSFIPVIFEMTVLFSAIGMVLAFLFRSKLYPHGEIITENEPSATDDRFVVKIKKPEGETLTLLYKLINDFKIKHESPEIEISEKNAFSKRTILSLTPFAIMVCLLSCNPNKEHPGYEYVPDMVYSRAYEYYSANPLDKSKSMAKVPPEGTIPRGFTPYPYSNTQEGYELAGKELINPLPANQIYIVEGKRLFNLYCVYCHGPEGEANGILIEKQKFPPPPSFRSELLKDLPAGKIFHSITYGKNLMGPHAVMLSQEERWRVVLFVEALQKR